MDIHAPERPIHSFKDFGIHIAIVTVGILIALSLEGIREKLYDRHLIRETRENVQQEMANDKDHAALEFQRVSLYRDQLKALVAAMPAIEQQHPDEVAAILESIHNPGYIFSANSWTAALSTGVLAHMPTVEVSSYAYAAEGIRNYTDLQHDLRQQETHTKAYFKAHPTMNADQLAEATERLMTFYNAEESAAYFCPQMQGDIDRALASSRH
jgi:hypothetical protein